jgi:predicted ATPase
MRVKRGFVFPHWRNYTAGMRIPVTLICGFLGAGKSTLIHRIVAEHPGRALAWY